METETDRQTERGRQRGNRIVNHLDMLIAVGEMTPKLFREIVLRWPPFPLPSVHLQVGKVVVVVVSTVVVIVVVEVLEPVG